MKVLFVINPISGGVDKEPFIAEAHRLCEKYGIEHRFFKTTGQDDEKYLKENIAEFEPDKIASVGGDGTTLFTGVALMGTNIPMGIIPLGSANGMATDLFVNLDPMEALKDLIMSEVTAGLDILQVNDEFYTLHLGDVGINAQLIDSYSKDKNRGMVTYAKYFIEEMKKLESFNFSIEANGEIIESKGLMVGVCNARKYGTGVPLNLDGNPLDGKFEIVVVQNVNLNSLIKAGLSKFDEKFYENQNGIVLSTDKAVISFDKERLLQLDGELVGSFKRIEINIIKGAVKLITHSGNTYLK